MLRDEAHEAGRRVSVEEASIPAAAVATTTKPLLSCARLREDAPSKAYQLRLLAFRRHMSINDVSWTRSATWNCV